MPTKIITVRIDQIDHDALKIISAREDRSLSWLVAEAVRRFVQQVNLTVGGLPSSSIRKIKR
jgi:hypothetical protein